MAELPDGMYTRRRHAVLHFEPAEYLYRRVPHYLWNTDPEPGELPIDVDALEMPDMSVARSRFAHPEWLRLATDCQDWAVVGFQVQDIPPERWIDGRRYDFRPAHLPEPRNYPHSEVRTYEHDTNAHVDGKRVLLPDRVHLEWRERLLRRVRVFLNPHEPAPIRDHAPLSHRRSELSQGEDAEGGRVIDSTPPSEMTTPLSPDGRKMSSGFIESFYRIFLITFPFRRRHGSGSVRYLLSFP